MSGSGLGVYEYGICFGGAYTLIDDAEHNRVITNVPRQTEVKYEGKSQ